MLTDSSLIHSLTLPCSFVRWGRFQAYPACSHTAVGDGWLCLESGCAVHLCFMYLALWVCRRAHISLSLWPPFPLLYSSTFLLMLGPSDILANTVKCPDWRHFRCLGCMKSNTADVVEKPFSTERRWIQWSTNKCLLVDITAIVFQGLPNGHLLLSEIECKQ